MRTIYLSAGHSNAIGKDRGATAKYKGFEIIEGKLAAEFVAVVSNCLKDLGATVVTDAFNNVLIDTIKAFTPNVKPNDIVIEYHFNAGGGTGTETFVSDHETPFERTLAAAVSASVASVLGIKIRGINGVKRESDSARKRLGLMRIPCEVVLSEVCFIDKESDMNAYFKTFNALALAQAKVLYNAAMI